MFNLVHLMYYQEKDINKHFRFHLMVRYQVFVNGTRAEILATFP